MATDEEVIPANDVPFADFCKLLQNLKEKKSKQEILTNFVNDFRIKVASVTGKKNSTFFPVLRLLLPDKERERSPYNLKEKKLGDLLVKVLSLSKNSSSNDAKKLLQFRSVNNGSDFAQVAYHVLKGRLGKNNGNLTIGDINNVLDKIASAEVGNKTPHLDEAFRYIMNHLTAEQITWFLRIVLKELKLGMGMKSILSGFHPDAPALFENYGNLTKVCEELEDGDTRPPELGVQLFFAISPMLSERLDVKDVNSLPNRVYQIENKFDGERFQMHMQNGVFEYFSRKGFKYAQNYGSTYETGLLTPLLRNCFPASVTSFILDGEMMGWHKHRQDFGSKGMAFDVKKLTATSKHQPCYCVFDVLMYNGKSLVGPEDRGGLPLAQRLSILDNLFDDRPGVILRSKRTIVQNSADILEALNKAIDDAEEGIVVKDTQSHYIPNRRNAGWYKIKPEYTEGTMSDLDLAIIGADDAENKRHGRARSFHVAAKDVVPDGTSAHRWVSVGRVATGLSHSERERVCAHLQQKWVDARLTPPPANLVFHKKTPDHWILPEHSIVLEVRASELIRSTDFGARYTLRFPRVLKVRDDKPVDDVISLDAYHALAEGKGAVAKLGNKRINDDQIDAIASKVPRKRTVRPLEVPSELRTGVVDVAVVSKALEGREISVMSGEEECSKEELVKIVLSHGGKHVENSGPKTWCVIAGKATPRVRKFIEAQEVDMATASWLRSLPPSDVPCELPRLDMLSMRKATRLAFRSRYDQFGDSYRDPVDVDTLRKCLRRMNPEEPQLESEKESTSKDIFDEQQLNIYLKTPAIYLTQQEMLDTDKLLFGDHNPYSYLRPCSLHFIRKGSVLELRAKMNAASTVDLDSPKLTHVVVPKNCKDFNFEDMRNKVSCPIVSEAWVEECLKLERLVPEDDFLLQENDS